MVIECLYTIYVISAIGFLSDIALSRNMKEVATFANNECSFQPKKKNVYTQ